MSRSTSATAGGEAGRRPAPEARHGSQGEFLEALDAVSRGIQDPVAKLRYIRSSLAKHEAADRALDRLPFAPLRRVLYRWLSLEALRPLLTTSNFGAPVVDARTRRASRAGRSGVVLASMAALLAVAATAWRLAHPPAVPPLVASAGGPPPPPPPPPGAGGGGPPP